MRYGPTGGGELSTCTYGEVSRIFLGQNIAKVIFLGPSKRKSCS